MWRFVERRVAGDTLEAIGAEAGLSRERVRQITEKLAPEKPWVTAKQRAVKLVEKARLTTAAEGRRYCATCGSWLPVSSGSHRRYCDATCRSYWDSLRYHIDDQRRAQTKRKTARWVLENPEGKSVEAIRYARRVIEGTAVENECRRRLVEGSSAWNVATRAVLNNWPIAKLLPRPIQDQIAVHLGHPTLAEDGDG